VEITEACIWRARKKISQPKEWGGLGLKDVYNFGKSLTAKPL